MKPSAFDDPRAAELRNVKTTVKRLRVRQLYALGFTQPEIGARLGLSKARVSKILNLTNNPELQRLHAARVALDKKLGAGEDVTLDDYYVEREDDE